MTIAVALIHRWLTSASVFSRGRACSSGDDRRVDRLEQVPVLWVLPANGSRRQDRLRPRARFQAVLSLNRWLLSTPVVWEPCVDVPVPSTWARPRGQLGDRDTAQQRPGQPASGRGRGAASRMAAVRSGTGPVALFAVQRRTRICRERCAQRDGLLVRPRAAHGVRPHSVARSVLRRRRPGARLPGRCHPVTRGASARGPGGHGARWHAVGRVS